MTFSTTTAIPSAASEQDLEHLSELFRLLSDRTRLGLLMALRDGERNVTDLCRQLGLQQPTVSHHLGLLRANSLIASRRSGKQVFYSLNGCVDVVSPRAIRIRMGSSSVLIDSPAGERGAGVEISSTGGIDVADTSVTAPAQSQHQTVDPSGR